MANEVILFMLVIASLFRDDVPWMYELGIEAYHAAKDGTPQEAAAARRRLQQAAEFMRHGPFNVETYGIDPQIMRMVAIKRSDNSTTFFLSLPASRNRGQIRLIHRQSAKNARNCRDEAGASKSIVT